MGRHRAHQHWVLKWCVDGLLLPSLSGVDPLEDHGSFWKIKIRRVTNEIDCVLVTTTFEYDFASA